MFKHGLGKLVKQTKIFKGKKQTQVRFYSQSSPINLFPKQPKVVVVPCERYLPIVEERLLLTAPEGWSLPVHAQDPGIVELGSPPPTGLTAPTGTQGGVPEGKPKKISKKEKDQNNINATHAENESAVTLASAGYRVKQLPENNDLGQPNPDYEIEGRVFDCKAPSTPRARNVARTLGQSVQDGQADRFVLNLDHSDLTLDDMRTQLAMHPVTGLKEVIAIKGGEIVHIFP